MHEAGPAATWAAQAKVGQYLGVGGPRGSLVIPTGFDWHLLIGDDTALPAIARRLEEMPAGKRVAAVIEVADPSAQIEFSTQAELHLVWCYRSEFGPRGEALLRAVRDTYLPKDGEGYVWAAGESATIRAVRQHLCTERGVDKSRIRAASYWKQGARSGPRIARRLSVHARLCIVLDLARDRYGDRRATRQSAPSLSHARRCCVPDCQQEQQNRCIINYNNNEVRPMYSLSTKHERRLLWLLALTQFTIIMDFMVMMPLGPQIMHAFSITPAAFATAVSAYSWCSGLSGLFAATYIDRFDRRRLLLCVYALFALSNLACALARSLPSAARRTRVCGHHRRRARLGDHGDCRRRDPGPATRRRHRHDHDRVFAGGDCGRAGRRDARRALRLGRAVLPAGRVVGADLARRLASWCRRSPSI